MKIAIVDDIEKDRYCAKQLILNYCAKNGILAECDLYSCGEDFLSVERSQNYDIVFLDIFMETSDGIKTAEHLRKRNSDCLIIFLTSSTEHRADAFLVHAFDYLEKPLCEQSVKRALNDALKSMTKNQPYIDIPIGKQTHALFYSDILSVTADSNYLMIHADTCCRCRMPFRSLSSILIRDKRFLVINRGVLVNLDYVVSMENLTCILTDGSSFPINRKKEALLKQAFYHRQFALRTGRVSKGGTP